MARADIPVANFTISDSAKRGIELVRLWFNGHSSDQAAVATVGWVRAERASGERSEHVAVTFYSRSQYAEIANAIQIVSDIEIIFLPVPRDHARFEGKVLDYSNERGFFLREP